MRSVQNARDSQPMRRIDGHYDVEPAEVGCEDLGMRVHLMAQSLGQLLQALAPARDQNDVVTIACQALGVRRPDAGGMPP